MDTHTLELLEFDRIRSLVASQAGGPLGKAAALRMEPGIDPGTIRHEQALTTEMAEALVAGLSPPLGGIPDVRPQVRRAQTGATLTAEELAEIADVLRSIAGVDRWLARVSDQFPRLGALKDGVGEFSGVAATIGSCLDSRGAVLDTASRRLSELRREIDQVEQRIQESLKRMLRSPEIRRILRYPNFTMVGHHYVLPIAKDHRGEIAGSVHRTSASNETVYVEPQAIAEQSAQISYLRAREAKEIKRILRWLSAQVGQVADALLATIETVAQLDLVLARARYGLDYQMTPPDLNTEGKVAVRGARHPLLEALIRERRKPAKTRPTNTENEPTPWDADGLPPVPDAFPLPAPPEEVVPIDLHLGFRFKMLVITGPNTGGKTVALKTLGLLVAMAQCGLPIPAREGSQLPIVDDVLADIGDEQSLEQSLSTFSSHIRRVSEILAKATERSLVILDELAQEPIRPKAPALGRAILDEIDAIGCLAMVTTHIGDLKTYAFTNPRAENAAVEFDVETLRPRYTLHVGDIGQSNALQIARRLSLPTHLVDRAARYLKQSRGDTLPEWEVVQKVRKDAEEAKREALAMQAEAQRAKEALDRRLADLQTQAQGDARLQEARAESNRATRVVVPRFGYDRPGRVVKLDPRKNTASVAIGSMKWDVPIDELIPQMIRTPEVPAAKERPPKPPPRLDDLGE